MNIFQKLNKKCGELVLVLCIIHKIGIGLGQKFSRMRTIDHVLGKDGHGSARAGPGQLYFSIQVKKMAENCQKTNFKKFR